MTIKRQCWFTYHALSDKDAAAIRKRIRDIADGNYTIVELVRVLKRNGYDVGASTISRHANGMCRQCDYGPR